MLPEYIYIYIPGIPKINNTTKYVDFQNIPISISIIFMLSFRNNECPYYVHHLVFTWWAFLHFATMAIIWLAAFSSDEHDHHAKLAIINCFLD